MYKVVKSNIWYDLKKYSRGDLIELSEDGARILGNAVEEVDEPKPKTKPKAKRAPKKKAAE